jgi:GNAT superfamily N-acetyltransferase
MIEIRPGQVTQPIKALFKRDMPTAVRCFAVLGGGNAGRIFIDKLDQPRMGFVWEQDDGTLYPGGTRDAASLAEMVSLLRKEAIVVLDFRDGDPGVADFPPDPDAGAECLELERPAHGSDLPPHLGLPAGYEVFRMGRDLLEKSPRLDETLHRYGDLDTFLAGGLNVCILYGDEYVCEAGADMDVGGIREVGIVTEPVYRGKGFGTIAVAHLLEWCDELGCDTYWDCVKLNIGSLKIARKLGYTRERGYKLHGWFPPREEVSIR